MKVGFNKISVGANEVNYLKDAIATGRLQGGGKYLEKCEKLVTNTTGLPSLITTSCTSALDITALLCDIKDGDEVIVPTFTFVSSISSFALRGAKPVFCDIRPDTLNIDETKIEALITNRTKVIVPVHYAGVACEMDAILSIARKHNLKVVEDAAQGYMSYYKGKHLGSIGDLGALSFHGTKNVVAGEGGAIVCGDESYFERANFIREKGTNRINFVQGKIDKYTWVDHGSSYIPSELITAFLTAQLESAKKLTADRVAAWNYYRDRLAPLERGGFFKMGKIPSQCKHNAHIFFITTQSPETVKELSSYLKSREIETSQHYTPLHLSPMAKKLGSPDTPLPIAEKLFKTMLRLPIYSTITPDEQDWVVDSIAEFFGQKI